jgi:TolB-like protein/Tfp pilus assembly protein PilF
MSFLGEIKRRKFFQVAAVYAVVAWLLVQVITSIEAPLNLPDWVDTLVIILLAIGFPITLIISWAFNLTPEGLVREGSGEAPTSGQGRGIEYVLIGLVVIGLGWLVYRVEFDSGGAGGAQREGVLPNSVAVLPFENLSPDPDNAYFAAGIHESTLNQLAKIHDLVVISRTSVMQYEDDRPPIPEIAEALNVATVMEGSVRYANGRVLITAQLIDGQSDAHLWSDEYNRDLADVFAVQAEVAEHIAMAMQVQLSPEEQASIANRPTASTEAYQHYLYALSLPPAVFFPEYLSPTVESLRKAIAVDPDFAEAYAELAWVYYNSPDRHLAVDSARKAIELDPTVGLAYYVIGMRDRYYYSRQEVARAAFERAVDLSPNDPTIVPNSGRVQAQLGFLFMRSGEQAAAIRQFEQAIALDPAIYTNYLDLATAEYLYGDRNAAMVNLDRTIQIKSPGATFRADYIAYLYGLLGETEHAIEFLAQQGELLEDPQADGWETLGWAALGTATVDGYLNDDLPVALGRISRFRDNWLNDPMLEEPEFLELRRRLGYEG